MMSVLRICVQFEKYRKRHRPADIVAEENKDIGVGIYPSIVCLIMLLLISLQQGQLGLYLCHVCLCIIITPPPFPGLLYIFSHKRLFHGPKRQGKPRNKPAPMQYVKKSWPCV